MINNLSFDVLETEFVTNGVPKQSLGTSRKLILLSVKICENLCSH